MDYKKLGLVAGVILLVVILFFLFFTQSGDSFSQTINYSNFSVGKTVFLKGSERVEEYSIQLENPVVGFLIIPKGIVSDASQLKVSGDFDIEVIQTDPILKIKPTNLSPGNKKITIKTQIGDKTQTSVLLLIPYKEYSKFSSAEKTQLDEIVKGFTKLDKNYFTIEESKKMMEEFSQKSAEFKKKIKENQIFFSESDSQQNNSQQSDSEQSSSQKYLTLIQGMIDERKQTSSINPQTNQIQNNTSDYFGKLSSQIQNILQKRQGSTSFVPQTNGEYTILIEFKPEENYDVPSDINFLISKESSVVMKSFKVKADTNITASIEGKFSEYFEVSAVKQEEGIYRVMVGVNLPSEVVLNLVEEEDTQLKLTLSGMFYNKEVTINLKNSFCKKRLEVFQNQINLSEQEKTQFLLECYSGLLSDKKDLIKNSLTEMQSELTKLLISEEGIQTGLYEAGREKEFENNIAGLIIPGEVTLASAINDILTAPKYVDCNQHYQLQNIQNQEYSFYIDEQYKSQQKDQEIMNKINPIKSNYLYNECIAEQELNKTEMNNIWGEIGKQTLDGENVVNPLSIISRAHEDWLLLKDLEINLLSQRDSLLLLRQELSQRAKQELISKNQLALCENTRLNSGETKEGKDWFPFEECLFSYESFQNYSTTRLRQLGLNYKEQNAAFLISKLNEVNEDLNELISIDSEKTENIYNELFLMHNDSKRILGEIDVSLEKYFSEYFEKRKEYVEARKALEEDDSYGSQLNFLQKMINYEKHIANNPDLNSEEKQKMLSELESIRKAQLEQLLLRKFYAELEENTQIVSTFYGSLENQAYESLGYDLRSVSGEQKTNLGWLKKIGYHSKWMTNLYVLVVGNVRYYGSGLKDTELLLDTETIEYSQDVGEKVSAIKLITKLIESESSYFEKEGNEYYFFKHLESKAKKINYFKINEGIALTLQKYVELENNLANFNENSSIKETLFYKQQKDFEETERFASLNLLPVARVKLIIQAMEIDELEEEYKNSQIYEKIFTKLKQLEPKETWFEESTNNMGSAILTYNKKITKEELQEQLEGEMERLTGSPAIDKRSYSEVWEKRYWVATAGVLKLAKVGGKAVAPSVTKFITKHPKLLKTLINGKNTLRGAKTAISSFVKSGFTKIASTKAGERIGAITRAIWTTPNFAKFRFYANPRLWEIKLTTKIASKYPQTAKLMMALTSRKKTSALKYIYQLKTNQVNLALEQEVFKHSLLRQPILPITNYQLLENMYEIGVDEGKVITSVDKTQEFVLFEFGPKKALVVRQYPLEAPTSAGLIRAQHKNIFGFDLGVTSLSFDDLKLFAEAAKLQNTFISVPVSAIAEKSSVSSSAKVVAQQIDDLVFALNPKALSSTTALTPSATALTPAAAITTLNKSGVAVMPSGELITLNKELQPLILVSNAVAQKGLAVAAIISGTNNSGIPNMWTGHSAFRGEFGEVRNISYPDIIESIPQIYFDNYLNKKNFRIMTTFDFLKNTDLFGEECLTGGCTTFVDYEINIPVDLGCYWDAIPSTTVPGTISKFKLKEGALVSSSAHELAHRGFFNLPNDEMFKIVKRFTHLSNWEEIKKYFLSIPGFSSYYRATDWQLVSEIISYTLGFEEAIKLGYPVSSFSSKDRFEMIKILNEYFVPIDDEVRLSIARGITDYENGIIRPKYTYNKIGQLMETPEFLKATEEYYRGLPSTGSSNQNLIDSNPRKLSSSKPITLLECVSGCHVTTQLNVIVEDIAQEALVAQNSQELAVSNFGRVASLNFAINSFSGTDAGLKSLTTLPSKLQLNVFTSSDTTPTSDWSTIEYSIANGQKRKIWFMNDTGNLNELGSTDKSSRNIKINIAGHTTVEDITKVGIDNYLKSTISHEVTHNILFDLPISERADLFNSIEATIKGEEGLYALYYKFKKWEIGNPDYFLRSNSFEEILQKYKKALLAMGPVTDLSKIEEGQLLDEYINLIRQNNGRSYGVKLSNPEKQFFIDESKERIGELRISEMVVQTENGVQKYFLNTDTLFDELLAVLAESEYYPGRIIDISTTSKLRQSLPTQAEAIISQGNYVAQQAIQKAVESGKHSVLSQLKLNNSNKAISFTCHSPCVWDNGSPIEIVDSVSSVNVSSSQFNEISEFRVVEYSPSVVKNLGVENALQRVPSLDPLLIREKLVPAMHNGSVIATIQNVVGLQKIIIYVPKNVNSTSIVSDFSLPERAEITATINQVFEFNNNFNLYAKKLSLQGTIPFEIGGENFVFEKRALEKAHRWFRGDTIQINGDKISWVEGNLRLERSGFFKYRKVSGIIQVFDFEPTTSYVEHIGGGLQYLHGLPNTGRLAGTPSGGDILVHSHPHTSAHPTYIFDGTTDFFDNSGFMFIYGGKTGRGGIGGLRISKATYVYNPSAKFGDRPTGSITESEFISKENYLAENTHITITENDLDLLNRIEITPEDLVQHTGHDIVITERDFSDFDIVITDEDFP